MQSSSIRLKPWANHSQSLVYASKNTNSMKNLKTKNQYAGSENHPIKIFDKPKQCWRCNGGRSSGKHAID